MPLQISGTSKRFNLLQPFLTKRLHLQFVHFLIFVKNQRYGRAQEGFSAYMGQL